MRERKRLLLLFFLIAVFWGCSNDINYTLKNNTNLSVTVLYGSDEYTLTPGQELKLSFPVSTKAFKLKEGQKNIYLKNTEFTYSVEYNPKKPLCFLNALPTTISLSLTNSSNITSSLQLLSGETKKIEVFTDDDYTVSVNNSHTENSFSFIQYSQNSTNYKCFYTINKTDSTIVIQQLYLVTLP